MSMAARAHHQHVVDMVAVARGRRPPVIELEPFTHEQLRVVAFPCNERHPVVEGALPGPSFLVYRYERFEPFDGFEALFAREIGGIPRNSAASNSDSDCAT